MYKSITKKWNKAMMMIVALFGANFGYSQINHLVISQVYGGGGNAGAVYTNDFIELFNPTASPISLTGISVQYTTSTGTNWSSKTNLTGSVAAGSYFLIAEASSGANGSPLPTPNLTGTIDLSATGGKVALFNSTVTFSGSCPSANLIDFVGFGTTADCREGAGIANNAPASSNTNAIIRITNGCTDANVNSTDFILGTPTPRNSASPTAINLSISSQTSVSCNGGSDGTATITAAGGSGYTYSWAPNGGTANTATGLSATGYTCSVFYSGCIAKQSVTITQPTVISASISSQTNVSCNGGSNGSAMVSATGGTPAYTYSWSPTGGTAATASGLAAGTYTCTITDAKGCTKTKTVTITQPSVEIVSISSLTNVSCNGGSNGSATVMVAGGTPPYTYSWLPAGGTIATASGLTAGAYTCTITDANGCTKPQIANITQPTTISISISANPSTICAGDSTTLTANSTGGTGNATYSWTGGITDGMAFTLSSTATYTVTATDDNGCIKTATKTITVNPLPTITATASPTTMVLGASTTLTATGASTYNWMPGNLTGTSVSVSPLSTNTFTVTGTNINGCVNTATTTVTVTANGGGGVTTKLSTADCGITVSSLTQVMHCDAISGATTYEYELIESGTGNIYTFARGNNYNDFQLSWVSEVTYGKTYTIRVHPQINGVFGLYGTSCTVTTPSFPTTQLQAAYCGISVSTLTQTLGCIAVPNATTYEYELTESGTGNVYTWKRGNNYNDFRLSWVPQVTYGRTYSIRVRAYQGTTFGPYGTACSVTTPAFPTTQLQASDCGITTPATSTVVHCVTIPLVTTYEYELTESGTGNVYTVKRGNNYNDFSITWFIPAAQAHSKTYSIRVRGYQGTTAGPYGNVCTLTMPATGKVANPEATPIESITDQVTINAYPNPTNGMLTIDASEKIMQISLYSLSGDLVIKDTPINQINLSDLPNAAYILVVRTETTVKHIRILKQE